VDTWSDTCNKIGEDLVLQFASIIDGQPLKAGSEIVHVTSEMDGPLTGSQLKKRNMEAMRLPIQLTFECDMNVKAEWRPDLLYLQRKFDTLGQAYETNLMNGYSALARERPDPWSPMSRLAISALNQVIARFPDIRTVMDVGCGDMSWMQYFLQDHPELVYVGVDILPFCLAINFRRFPKSQFIQTDLSNLSGIEVLPQNCDLVIAKDIFTQMVLPDAVDALRRVVSTRPRFLLTHIQESSNNAGWETRIDEHLAATPYNYNKSPFNMPYPVIHVQRITDDSAYVLYQITPDLAGDVIRPPPLVQELTFPEVGDDLEAFVTVAEGEWVDALAPRDLTSCGKDADNSTPLKKADELGPRPAERAAKADVAASAPEKKPIKGIPAVEFRARCDLIFEKFDRDKDGSLCFEELVALMDAGGRRIEEYDDYAGLCSRLGCDSRVGLTPKDVYKLFEKAPQSVWEEVYRSINPLALMVKKGAAKLPETFLEKPLPNFLFDDAEEVAKVVIDINDHLYFGAAEVVSADHVQAYFGKQRIEVHIVAPGSYGAKDLFLWRLAVTPLSGEIVPEDCKLEVKETSERAGMRCGKVVIRLTKSKKKRWGKLGQASTGQRI